jgi:hypothetical protein
MGYDTYIYIGVFLFSLQQGKDHMNGHSNMYGLFFLFGYIVSDSFTAQYQV